jgi:primosomal protein N''
MSEEQVVAQEGTETQDVQAQFNPFDETSWVEAAPTAAPQGEETQVAQATATQTTVEENKQTNTVDYSAFVKETFGFESVDEIKSAIDEYKVLKSTPKTEVEFSNEISKNLYQALLEGKEAEVYSYLAEKQKVDRLANLEVTDAKSGLEILAAKLANQYKELTPDEIEYKLSKQYRIPEQPVRDDYDTDEDYERKLSAWQKEKSLVEKEIIVDAKIAKPEIAKIELVLPDVLKSSEKQATQQEQGVQVDPAVRQKYLDTLKKEYNLFDGFKVAAKDEDVEVAVAYTPTNEEKLALKNVLENFNADEFLGSMWISDEGKFNTKQAMEDLYLLQNKEKVFQKIANEAVSQFKVGLIKAKKNINLTSTSGGAYQGNTNGQAEIPADAVAYFFENS